MGVRKAYALACDDCGVLGPAHKDPLLAARAAAQGAVGTSPGDIDDCYPLPILVDPIDSLHRCQPCWSRTRKVRRSAERDGSPAGAEGRGGLVALVDHARLVRPMLDGPVADLAEGRWRIFTCSRCLKPEHELPVDVRQQIAGLRDGTWPTPGQRGVWFNTCHCGGVVYEINVMVKPGRWECPDCDVDMGAPTCPECEAEWT